MKRETIKRIETHSFGIVVAGSLVVMVLLSLIGLLVFSTEFALGIIVGGVVAILNHVGLYRSLKGLLLAASKRDTGDSDEERRVNRGTSSALFGFYLRIILSGFIIYFALKGGWANPLALFVGASVVVLNSFIVAILMYKID